MTAIASYIFAPFSDDDLAALERYQDPTVNVPWRDRPYTCENPDRHDGQSFIERPVLVVTRYGLVCPEFDCQHKVTAIVESAITGSRIPRRKR
jgi:hypothetical protein